MTIGQKHGLAKAVIGLQAGVCETNGMLGDIDWMGWNGDIFEFYRLNNHYIAQYFSVTLPELRAAMQSLFR